MEIVMKKNFTIKAVQAINALKTRKICIECDHIPYTFENVPLKKILNWLLVETTIALKTKKAWGFPTHLQIEPSTLCNLRCAFCPVTTGMNRQTGHMTLRTFQKVIDEIGQYLFLILLWDWGEPFLNPAIYDMIAYARTRDIKIVSSTNAHIFAKGDHAEKLVRSGINSIICAVDGISQKTYETYRVRGNIETAIQGIQNIVAAKKKSCLKTPLVHFRFLPTKHNEHEIPKLKEFARSLGVDALSLKTINPHDHEDFHSNSVDGKDFIPLNPKYQRFNYDTEGFPIRNKNNSCKRLWNCPVIHWNGKVSPCTFDPNDSYTLGDLGKESFKKIWSGSSYRKYRSEFRKNYRKLTLCKNCSCSFEGGMLSTECVADAHFFNSPL
jgi:radical SAM protein with 4Fe4S-binding SPASM domain